MSLRGVAIIVSVLASGLAHAYPNLERSSVSTGLSQSVQFQISKDNQSLYIAYGNTFKIFDTGSFALATTQPFAISSDTKKYPGNYKGVIYFNSQSAVFLPMDNGTMMKFNLNDVGAAPTILTVTSGKTLGNGVADTVGGDHLYIINATDTGVVQYQISTNTATQIPFSTAIAAAGFSVTPTLNQINFSPQSSRNSSEVYVSTSTNMLIYFNLQTLSPQITLINPNNNLTDSIQGISPTPNKSNIYTADSTANTFAKVQISNHAVQGTPTSVSPNNQPTYILIADVTNPTATYGYVTGVQGVTIFDTSNHDIFDLGVTSTDDEPLQVSGVGPMVASTDGYIYIDAASGNIGVISDNPFVTVNSVTYPSGKSSLGIGGTVTINFKSDEKGTYVVRAGGNVSGNGTLLKDSSGATSGTVSTANTAQDAVIPYDSNSSAFQEGDNTVYFFVTDSTSNVGRRSTTVKVDTPPGAVTVLGTSFGNSKAYINFSRLTANDISKYNLYADTDSAAVKTKATVSATVSQGSDSTLTGTITGLANGTTYYLAIEGVDTAGNVGARTSTLSSGASISATPEVTVGPAGFTGETGCSLLRGADIGKLGGVFLVLGMIGLGLGLRLGLRLRGQKIDRRFRSQSGSRFLILILILISNLESHTSSAADIRLNPPPEPLLAPIKKYGWFVDGRAQLWQPTSPTTKRFFPQFYNFQGMVSGGFLYNEQFGAEVGVGFFYKTGQAIAAGSGAVSQDGFKLLTVPMTIGGAYRGLYKRGQWVVPYARGGFEMDFFRENDSGTKVKGLKKGLYGGLGVQVPVSQWLDATDVESHRDSQVYVIFEGLYRWLNDFGGKGLNLSGALYSAGFLVTF